MDKIIEGRYLKYVKAGLGYHGDSHGSVKQVTHDGDTLKVYDRGNISIRFLGIDTPEISFEINGDGSFRPTDSEEWINYIDNIEDYWPGMKETLGQNLYAYIMNKTAGKNAAVNHHFHAEAAEDHLEHLIEAEYRRMNASRETFMFFLPLSYEIFDCYGRLLSFVHTDDRRTRPISFNEMLLRDGFALPYFIFPNINPFRKEASIAKAVYDNPADFRAAISGDRMLNKARESVREARAEKAGLFDQQISAGALILEAFELRFLSRRTKPGRAFIDLTENGETIHRPEDYYKVLPEDRLFIPDHFIPLFHERGWV